MFISSYFRYALNGAEIIFNPSAELCGNLSDKNWFVEGRAEAVANSVFTVTVGLQLIFEIQIF